MKLILLGTSAALLLSASVSGQTPNQLPTGSMHRSVAPSKGVYNMETGFEIATHSYRSGPATIFDNTDGIGYYFSTLSDTEEWIDSMAFVDSGALAPTLGGVEQINGFDFNYCSLLADPVGDAITVEVRFYDDNPGGAEPTGWTDLVANTVQNATCAFQLAGLPGDTSLAGISCWGIAVDLMCGFECTLPQEHVDLAAGEIPGATRWNGIGWMYMDGLGGGNTGPTLGSTVTTAGPGTAIPGYGSKDLFELMDLSFPGAEHQGTFFFGGAPKAQATFDVVLFGDGIEDTRVINADAPLAGDNLCLGSDVPFKSGNSVTFNMTGGLIGGDYYLLFSGSLGTQVGIGATPSTLIISSSLLLPPVLMDPGVTWSTGSLPAGLPSPVYVQGICLPLGAPLRPGNVVSASNALCFD